MKTEGTKTFELTVEKTVEANPERVFAAFTEPDHLRKWFAPEGMRIPEVDVDLRVGGRFQVVMEAPDGSARHTAVGTYREVSPPHRLVKTWSWLDADGEPGHQTRITIELHQEEGGTRVVMHHEGFEAAESRDRHQEGWTSTLERLPGLVG